MKVPLSEKAKLLLNDPDASRELMVAMFLGNKEKSGGIVKARPITVHTDDGHTITLIVKTGKQQ